MFRMLTSQKLVVVGPMVLLTFFALYVNHSNMYFELRPGTEVNLSLEMWSNGNFTC